MRSGTSLALGLLVALAGAARAADSIPLSVLLATSDASPIGGAFISGIGGWAAGADGVVASRDMLDRNPSQVIIVHGVSNRLAAALNGAAPGGGTYLQLGALAVADAGAVVFRADVEEGTDRRSAIFRVEADGSGSRVVSSGDATPLGDGSTFALDENDDTTRFLVAANGTGMVAFRGKDSAGRQGLFRAANGVLVRVAIAGDSEPDLGIFASFGTPGLADDGTVVFFGAATGGKKGIFRANPDGSIDTIAVLGGDAPNGTWTAVDEPAIGPDGTIAFRGSVKTPTATIRGIFIARADGVAQLVGEGEGGPGGGAYETFGPPTVGEAGAVAFRAGMTAPAEAIVAITDTPHLIAGTGDESGIGTFCPSPSTDPCFGDPVFGARGRLAFRGALNGTDVDRALFLAVIETTGARPSLIAVDCNAGQHIQSALDQIAEGGVVRVRGICHENVSIHNAGRLTLQAETPPKKRKKRTKPTRLVALDPTKPALDVLTTAGATTVLGFTMGGGSPTLRVDGVGHVLQNLTFDAGARVVVTGPGHTLSALRMRRGAGPCITVSGTGVVLSRNDVQRCRGDGITLTGDGGSVAVNRVVGSRGRGLVVTGVGNSIAQNRVSGNRRGGIIVDGRDNALTANRAGGNRGGGFRAAACNIDLGKNRPKLKLPACPAPAAALATPQLLP